jgi:hypothetical protein
MLLLCSLPKQNMCQFMDGQEGDEPLALQTTYRLRSSFFLAILQRKILEGQGRCTKIYSAREQKSQPA